MELNEELRGNCDDGIPEPPIKKEVTEDKPFSSGENKFIISNGNFTIEAHCTNSTPEQIANITSWLFQQAKGELKTKEGVSYLQ